MKILVTGGTGYIGSHTVVELLVAGYEIVILDNLSNSSRQVLTRIHNITGTLPIFIEGDISDKAILDNIFTQHKIIAVIHFAGLKAVGESVKNPLEYYKNNVVGSLVLLESMAKAGIFTFVFSSSATVYGDPEEVPINESAPIGHPNNPYGYSKLMTERVLEHLANSDPRWAIAILRYFNPIGAHKSGMIGEDPHGIPNNLLPYISQVAIGKLKELSVYGHDYPTKDGTGVRDYIHVVDLARGHLAALNYLYQNLGHHIWNLGTGIGYSVLEIISAFEKVADLQIPFRFTSRRSGDIAACWSNPTKAIKELKWQATFNLEDMIRDTWHWQTNNPQGYRPS